MDGESAELTMFSCPFGKFKFLRMLFGLKNAPAIFQAALQEILRRIRKCCKYYVDDVFVYSASWEQHLSDI